MTVIGFSFRAVNELPRPKPKEVARCVHVLNPNGKERRRAALLEARVARMIFK